MFFGTGAYTSSILLITFGIPPIFGIFVAVLMGAFLGFLVGYLSFRSGLRGSYFALITLAFANFCAFWQIRLNLRAEVLGFS